MAGELGATQWICTFPKYPPALRYRFTLPHYAIHILTKKLTQLCCRQLQIDWLYNSPMGRRKTRDRNAKIFNKIYKIGRTTKRRCQQYLPVYANVLFFQISTPRLRHPRVKRFLFQVENANRSAAIINQPG
jgi:hypothetical protein